MKYEDVGLPEKIVEGQLRVCHIPQFPMKQSFKVYVDSTKEAKKVMDILAIYDLFQFEYKVKAGYSNACFFEVFEGGEWSPQGQMYWYNIHKKIEQGEQI